MVGRQSMARTGVASAEVLYPGKRVHITVRDSALPTFQTTLRICENVTMTAMLIVISTYVAEIMPWYRGRRLQ